MGAARIVRSVIASGAKQSSFGTKQRDLDCFVASLLAMTFRTGLRSIHPLPLLAAVAPGRGLPAGVIRILDAHGGAARGRHPALVHRGITAFEIAVVIAHEDLQADRIFGI